MICGMVMVYYILIMVQYVIKVFGLINMSNGYGEEYNKTKELVYKGSGSIIIK